MRCVLSELKPTEVLDAIVGEGFTVDDLKKATVIDVNELVFECAVQPSLYAAVARMSIKAKTDQGLVVSELDLTKATVGSAMRKDPESFKIPKVTDKSIAEALDTNNIVLAAKEKLIDANEQVQAASVLVGVFEQRKAMIKCEVDLFTTKLYNETSIRGKEIGETREAIAVKRAEAARDED